MEKRVRGRAPIPLSDEASRKMTTWLEEKEVAR